MSDDKRIVVRFNANWRGYNAGEKATYHKDEFVPISRLFFIDANGDKHPLVSRADRIAAAIDKITSKPDVDDVPKEVDEDIPEAPSVKRAGRPPKSRGR